MGKKSNGTILVPIDFSEHSKVALVHAAALAEQIGAQLVILHVVHDLGEAPGYYSVKGRNKQLRRMNEVASEMLEAFVKEVREEEGAYKTLKDAQTRLVTGLPITRILEMVKELSPIMVIMGSQGRTGLSRLVLGSKAEQCVRLCPAPVMIVKKDWV